MKCQTPGTSTLCKQVSTLSKDASSVPIAVGISLLRVVREHGYHNRFAPPEGRVAKFFRQGSRSTLDAGMQRRAVYLPLRLWSRRGALRMYRALGASPDRPHREITPIGGVRLHYSDFTSLLPGNPYLRSVEPAALEARSAKRDHWV